jgi:predicted negative regulator of RcsB-dependent stress response
MLDQYAGTAYAPRAALLYAKQLWSAGDKAGAKAQLTWVVDRSSDDDLKQIARYRLAEVLLDEKNVDEALKVLDAKHADAYAGLYADLRGDALAAAGRTAEARAAYQLALAKIDAKTPYRNFIQVKLDALGGPASPDAVAPAPAGARAVPPTTSPRPAPAPDVAAPKP